MYQNTTTNTVVFDCCGPVLQFDLMSDHLNTSTARFVCDLFDLQDKQWFFLSTVLSDWLLERRDGVFLEGYELTLTQYLS